MIKNIGVNLIQPKEYLEKIKHIGVYLVQPQEFIQTNVYKIGRTDKNSLEERIKAYGKETKTYILFNYHNPPDLEKKIKDEFNLKFKLHRGREYFEGDIEDMKKVFYSICNKHIDVLPIQKNLEKEQPIQETLDIEEIIKKVKPLLSTSSLKIYVTNLLKLFRYVNNTYDNDIKTLDFIYNKEKIDKFLESKALKTKANYYENIITLYNYVLDIEKKEDLKIQKLYYDFKKQKQAYNNKIKENLDFKNFINNDDNNDMFSDNDSNIFSDDENDININNEDDTKPKHYKLKIDPREYITKNKLDFNEGNIIKYVTRYKSKNGLEDLLKAKDYLEYIIKNYK